LATAIGLVEKVIRLAIAGAGGRMGQMLMESAATHADLAITAAFDIASSPALGKVLASGVSISADVPAGLANADCLIDFTRPDGTLAHLAACVTAQKAMVIGTTGFDAAGKAAIAIAAKSIPIVFAPNMGVGVNVTLKLLELAARALNEDYDIEIVEMHHRHKVDAPSGTALGMGEVIAKAQGTRLEDRAVLSREGHTGERKPGAIGFAALRGGDVIGDHTVIFAGTGERIEISHKSGSRLSYANGALRAAKFLASKRSGLFDMQDVLGFKAPV
jgi:4-hydroxy-tetrahydrodipicolinate reductase